MKSADIIPIALLVVLIIAIFEIGNLSSELEWTKDLLRAYEEILSPTEAELNAIYDKTQDYKFDRNEAYGDTPEPRY